MNLLNQVVHRSEERLRGGGVLRGGHVGQARVVAAGGDRGGGRAEAAAQHARQLRLVLRTRRLQADLVLPQVRANAIFIRFTY